MIFMYKIYSFKGKSGKFIIAAVKHAKKIYSSVQALDINILYFFVFLLSYLYILRSNGDNVQKSPEVVWIETKRKVKAINHICEMYQSVGVCMYKSYSDGLGMIEFLYGLKYD